jgi:hypothetical protein
MVERARTGVRVTWLLFTCWVVVFAVASDQSRSASNFRGASQGFRALLGVSAILAFIAAFVLLGWIGWQVAWWWVPVLFAVGSVAGALLLIVGQKLLGQLGLTMLGFAAWPVGVAGSAYLLLAAAR